MEVKASVVLAGGLSRRFGRDKLLYPVEGKPILVRVVESVREVVERVIVVTNGERRAKTLKEMLGVPVLVDRDMPCSGPVRGVLTAGFIGPTLVLPADLPWITKEAVEELISSFEGAGSAEVYGVYYKEAVESLITLVVKEAPFRAALEACRLKGARVTDFHRSAESLLLMNLMSLRHGWRFADVDRPEDLTPKPWQGQGLEFRYRRFNDLYIKAMEALKEGQVKRAVELFELEGRTWEFGNVKAHCLKDAKNLTKM